MSISRRQTCVWKYCGVYKMLRCQPKSRLCTKMLRIHLFGIFTIKTPRALAALTALIKRW